MTYYSKNILVVLLMTLVLFSCNKEDNQQTNANHQSKPLVTETTSKAIKEDGKTINEDGETYVEGADYIALPKVYDTQDKNHVVVYEFFSYACPHCYTFEPFVNKWLKSKPNYVKFVRVPMSFHPSWADLQLAYLTAETMGVAEQAHSKLFDALHKQHKRLNSIEEIAQWYADETGVDKNAFLSTADSFILDSKLRKADKMGYEMQATSTPTLVINGKYKAAKGKNRDDIMKILSFLIEKEGKTMGLIQ